MGVYGGVAIAAGLVLLVRLCRAERRSVALWMGIAGAAWLLVWLLLGLDSGWVALRITGSGFFAVVGTLIAFFFGVTIRRMREDADRERAHPPLR